MFKKMIQNAKAKRAKRNEEIAKFKAEWYARPYLDRVKKPAITFAVSFALGLYFEPHSEIVSIVMFLIALGAGFLTVIYGLGGRPLSPVEAREAPDTLTDPTYHYLSCNIYNDDR